MKNNSQAGYRLFFIEFLIVLFFFLIVSSVCLRLFGKAHQISQKANALSGAQNVCASIASLLEAGLTSPEELSDFFPGAEISDQSLFLYYDKDFQPTAKDCSSSNPVFYTLEAQLSSADETQTVITVIQKNQEALYTLPLSFHHAITRKEAHT